MTAEMFLAYLEQCLCPTLQRGEIVVIDNCRPHTSPRVRKVIEKARATLRYLPKYSLTSTRSRWHIANSRSFCVASKREPFRLSTE
jgi:transposase